MRKMLFTLFTMLTIAASANAMSYEQARDEALFLTDKMAYELNLTDAQYEAAYEINLDYLMSVTSQSDVFGICWERRNKDLNYILYSWQWSLFYAASYFYRPLYWEAGLWHFGIYVRYPHRDYFYFGRPHFYATYHGGHSWRMNGGRSYYASRTNIFRPNIHRNNHFGMRNGWDRGDYHNGGHHSSTRVTVEHGRNRDNRPGSTANRPDNSHGNTHSSNGHFSGNRSENGHANGNRPNNNHGNAGAGNGHQGNNRGNTGIGGNSHQNNNRGGIVSGNNRLDNSHSSVTSGTNSHSFSGQRNEGSTVNSRTTPRSSSISGSRISRQNEGSSMSTTRTPNRSSSISGSRINTSRGGSSMSSSHSTTRSGNGGGTRSGGNSGGRSHGGSRR